MITNRNVFKRGHLTARPHNKVAASAIQTGVQPLHLSSGRDGLIYVPKNYSSQKPAALAVMLHGSGGQAEHGLHLLQQYADDRNIILLSPASREETWDIIVKNAFDGDVIFINQALALIFDRYAIDPSFIAIGGFSDGASYALSLGISNGDLFTHIIAFSPGFYYSIENKGTPAVYISHGVHDRILPIEPCSRRIVPKLEKGGYTVNYREFEGEHVLPADISASAVEWFLRR